MTCAVSDRDIDAEIWPSFDREKWVTNLTGRTFSVNVQPCRPRDTATQFVKAAGAKRIRYGYNYRVRVAADGCGCFVPKLEGRA